jgi:hypothetical protein
MRYTTIYLPLCTTAKRRGLIRIAALVALVSLPGVTLITESALAGDAIYTTNEESTVVNENIYASSPDVYISGGPQNAQSAGLPGHRPHPATHCSLRTSPSADN